MARGKKKESLTPEERLQAALVPESEQPYKAPKNWCWTRLGQLYQINPKNVADDFTDAAFIPMEKIAAGFVNEYSFEIQPWSKAKKGHTQFADGDVAFAKISPCFENRKSMLLNGLPNGIGGGTTELVILRQAYMHPKYTFWFVSQEQFIRGGVATYSGTVGQQRISMDYVRTYPIPVPPLAEQQRIVDRIESLFAKLDEAKQKAQESLDSFETRKAAILHKAFTGELTAQWRKEHGVGMESWENVSVSEICHSLKYGTAKKSSSEGTVVVIRMGNLQDGEISWDDLAYSNDEEDIEKYKLIPGDVLFNRTNSPALVGKTSIYRGEYPAIYAGYLIKLDYDRSRVIGDYLNYSLNTVSAKEYCNSVKTDGVNQSNINAKKIGAYRFDMPKINEQTEIVRLLNDLLAKEQQAKEVAQGVLEQIELIKKAILARAFRGQLGTNDPSEESAIELLKTVI